MLALLVAAIPLVAVFAEEQAPEVEPVEAMENIMVEEEDVEVNNLVEEATSADSTEL